MAVYHITYFLLINNNELNGGMLFGVLSTSYGNVYRARLGKNLGFLYFESGSNSLPNGNTTLLSASDLSYVPTKSITVQCISSGTYKYNAMVDSINGFRILNTYGSSLNWITAYIIFPMTDI